MKVKGATQPRQWFRMQVADDGQAADIYIFDMIGNWLYDLYGIDGVTTAKGFIEELNALPATVKTIRVHVNSPGGDVFDAVTIANALRDQRTTKGRAVETSVEGLAASAASFIIQAGDPIRIADNALVMVHNPWGYAIGNAKDARKFADELDTIRDAIVATYQWHSELDADEIIALLDAETWLDADEAIAKGFATEKVKGLKAAALIPRDSVRALTVPEHLRARVDALLAVTDTGAPEDDAPRDAMPPLEVIKACRAAGFADLAEELVSAQATEAQVAARLETATTERRAATERATAIRNLCTAAKFEDLADGWIANGLTLEGVKNSLARLTVRREGGEIDSALPPEGGREGIGASWKGAFDRIKGQ